MKFSAILLITTVLSGVYADEVTTKDSLETVAPTELIVPDIFEVVHIVNDLDTIAPSKFVTDDDWDPAFKLDEELTMQRLLQVNETNETLTNTVYFQADICSTDCANTAATVRLTFYEYILAMLGLKLGLPLEVEKRTTTQGACGQCSANRFLQETGRSLQDGSQSTTITVEVVLSQGVDGEALDTFLASADFDAVTEALEDATGGVVSNVVASVTAPTTDSPTLAPTDSPTKSGKSKKSKGTKSTKSDKKRF